MSREKECKCCHEWWCASDIKEDLCPNCYDYFKQLKQQLAEKEKELLKQKEKSARTEQIYNRIIVDKDKEIEKLKSEIVKECKEHQEFIKEAKQITNQLKSNYQTQLAIQELEKTLNFIENVFDKALKNCSLNNVYYDQILDFIDQQIKELSNNTFKSE